MTIELTNEQKGVHDAVVDWYKGSPGRHISVGGLAGTGKEQPIDTKVQTPNGPISLGDIHIGDTIFGRDGKGVRVTGVFPQGTKQSYTIKFSDGSSTECGLDHLWTVTTPKLRQLGKWKTLSLRDILKIGLKMPCGTRRFSIPLCQPVSYAEQDLPIDPYLLGIIIGDGCCVGNSPCISIADHEPEILYLVQELVPDWIRIRASRYGNRCPQYYLVDDRNCKKNELLDNIRELGLDVKSSEKFIPQKYMFGSIDQRNAILRGLMDSDGCSIGNRARFGTKSIQLALDISNLVESLGGTAKIGTVERRNSKEYYVNIKTLENPFKINRKAKNWKLPRFLYPIRSIIDVKKGRLIEQVCIKVDAVDNLYLTDHYIVTHNTTVIGFIADTLKKEFGTLPIAYVCYTGKASLVLAKKLRNLDFNDSVGTIHSLIYRPIVDEDGSILGWARKDDVDASLIIVDEASMVDKDIWKDLVSYGIPILAVGDHGQLPPIGESNFSLMRRPDLKLVTVHRQALENPIIKLSLYVRRHGCIPTKVFGRTAAKLDYSYDQRAKDILYGYDFRTDSQILCGMNKTRVKLNDLVRGTNGFDCDDPLPGEKLICLKNNRELGIMNGQMGSLNEAKLKTENLFDLNITMDGYSAPMNVLTYRGAFGEIKYDQVMKDVYNDKILVGLGYDRKPKVNVFDFGYAISVHKSQGSEFQRVILIEERNSFQSDDEYTRWLYTGITRASEKLVVIDNFY